MKRIILLIAIGTIIFSCENKADNDKTKHAKNIILMIGDGMGVTQLYAAISVSDQPLNLEKFKNIGFHKTSSADNYITDSGAGGTAISTGHKTNNYYIAVDSSGKELKTITEYVKEDGLAAGVVVTSNITHATPASFVAHIDHRTKCENIAFDILNLGLDLFIGGGENFFIERSDSLNLIDSLKERGYQILNNMDEISLIDTGKLAGFTAFDHLPSIKEGRGDMLDSSLKTALKLLNHNPNGFFLLVEGSQIDWGGHDKDIDYVISEILDFDKAVGR
ncbi:MAG: alkaline phosphatase, partial [Marinilabiliales bacterium]